MTPPFTPEVLARWPEAAMVALDIDGTLMGHDGSITDGVREAVQGLKDRGVRVVLATGRSVVSALPVAREFGLTGPLVCSNGGVTVEVTEDGHEVTEAITFDPGPVLRRLRERAPDALYAVEDLGRGFQVTRPFPIGELGGAEVVVPFEEMCARPASRVTVRAPELTNEEFVELVMGAGLHGVSFAVGWSSWLDINPPGVSKATALEPIRARFGVAPEHTLAAGDGSNDDEMLAWAGVGVAMGGAIASTVAAADRTTGPVEEDGIVPVLRALL